MRRRKNAFSLIELLLALSVVAVLSALAVAGVARARKSAATAKCTGHLRVIFIGLSNFINDKGHYPGMRVTTRPTAWHHALEPYVTGNSVPASDAPASSWAQCPGRTPDSTGPLGYAYNQYFGNIPPTASDFSDTSPFASYWQLRPPQIINPAQKIVIGDGRDDNVISNFSKNALRASSNPDDSLLPRRHSKGGHYLHADGHVELLTPEEFVKLLLINKSEILKPF